MINMMKKIGCIILCMFLLVTVLSFTATCTANEEPNIVVNHDTIPSRGFSVYVKNEGKADALNVNWKIEFHNCLMFYGAETYGFIKNISHGEELKISANSFLGFAFQKTHRADPYITVDIDYDVSYGRVSCGLNMGGVSVFGHRVLPSFIYR